MEYSYTERMLRARTKVLHRSAYDVGSPRIGPLQFGFGTEVPPEPRRRLDDKGYSFLFPQADI